MISNSWEDGVNQEEPLEPFKPGPFGTRFPEDAAPERAMDAKPEAQVQGTSCATGYKLPVAEGEPIPTITRERWIEMARLNNPEVTVEEAGLGYDAIMGTVSYGPKVDSALKAMAAEPTVDDGGSLLDHVIRVKTGM